MFNEPIFQKPKPRLNEAVTVQTAHICSVDGCGKSFSSVEALNAHAATAHRDTNPPPQQFAK